MNINVKNGSILISFMDALSDPRFDMREYFHGCGSPSCALGWATTIPALSQLKKKHPMDASVEVFGVDAYYPLFNGRHNSHIRTPKQWADHARAFLKEHGLAAPEQKFPDFMERVLKPVPLSSEVKA